MNYILDLSKEEFRDDYANKDSSDDNELWQVHAKEQLIYNLDNLLHDAEKYKNIRKIDKHRTWLSHNSILITSPRGSGKTVFLRNINNMWKHSKHGESNSEKLFFLDVIDPTMLMDNDSFANVIIAQIYQAVSDRLSNCCDIIPSNRDVFHHSLKKLADSIGKTSEFNGSFGIDKILKYSSGIQIERNFHHFVESAIKILDCSAIVVLIDDVDMALQAAFAVVDEVRRYLGCPYIIPVVSGDLKLYEHMTEAHFDSNSHENLTRNRKLIKNGCDLSKDLTEAYLTKVFPTHTRISLFSIEHILSKLIIKEKDIQTNYFKYRECLFDYFSYLCHNRDSRKEQFKPNSARELNQLVHMIKPSELSEKNKELSTSINLFIKCRSWAQQQKQGDVYTNADSAISLLDDSERLFNINDFLAFNIKEQSNSVNYPWANYHIYDSQKDAIDKLTQVGSEINNKELLNCIFDVKSKVLKPMPPLEFLANDFFISSNTVRNVAKGSEENALLDIYTEGELYSTLNNTKRFIFFSRAFELLVYSLLKRRSEFKFDEVNNIIKRKPFYSIVNLAETKIAVTGDEDVIEDDIHKGNSTNEIINEIKKWQESNSENLNLLSVYNLIPIFSYVFNSVFTSLNVIKSNYMNGKSNRFKNEHLSDMVLRYKYNILNSILRVGIYGEAVYANVLTNALSDNIRHISKLLQTERVYTRNKSRLESEIESLTETNDIERFERLSRLKELKILHDMIDKHPIFTFLKYDKDDMSIPMLKIGHVSKNANVKTQIDIQIGYIESQLGRIAKRITNVDTYKRRLENAISSKPKIKNSIILIKEIISKESKTLSEQDWFKEYDDNKQTLLKAIIKIENFSDGVGNAED